LSATTRLGETPADLGPDTIKAFDATHQFADVLGLADHLDDALWRVESASIEPQDSPGGLVVAGMGGSAVGGLLARAALGDRATRRFTVSRDYGLPAWTTPDTTVLCSSYSGNTEETLTAFEAAGALGARRIVCTTGGQLAQQARAESVPVIGVPGGFYPRAAVGYMLVVALEIAALTGVGEGLRTEIDVAAAAARRLGAAWGPDSPEDSLAKSLARKLHGTVAQIMGSGLTAPIAYRWKTQINENAKLPAFCGELPEVDHNELVGWTSAATAGRFAAVFLDDSDLHPRVRERIDLTRELVRPHAVVDERVASVGETRTERLVSLVLLGDLVSLYLAVLAGQDPGPIALLDELKRRLGPSGS
jgi:glucose/mannose-6-phosphate isomerase